MKKTIIQIIILLLVIAGLSVALFSLKHNKTGQSESNIEEVSEFSIFSVEANDITAFSFTIESGELLSFHLEDEAWVYDYDDSLVLDQAKMANILSLLSNLDGVDIYDDREPEEFGLDNPPLWISITTTDYTTEIYFGDINQEADESFVIINGDASNIYVCKTNMKDVSSYNLEDLLAQ